MTTKLQNCFNYVRFIVAGKIIELHIAPAEEHLNRIYVDDYKQLLFSGVEVLCRNFHT